MYEQVISEGPTAEQELFTGNPLGAGDNPNPGEGSLEYNPHGRVHLWTADWPNLHQPNYEYMGNFYSGAVDRPVFFARQYPNNIDRLWNVWMTPAVVGYETRILKNGLRIGPDAYRIQETRENAFQKL
ncbi:hypothetical protein KSP40_PGU019988 [Platanthera guangdongensis]|uniref:Tyrosinase copper-binding domain-containing protein n=1 Tax=Platanthera guangdongensis TaxID=2320717 RepID=A0ABR2N3K5_9ASPA